jgi:hypothetical protein
MPCSEVVDRGHCDNAMTERGLYEGVHNLLQQEWFHEEPPAMRGATRCGDQMSMNVRAAFQCRLLVARRTWGSSQHVLIGPIAAIKAPYGR